MLPGRPMKCLRYNCAMPALLEYVQRDLENIWELIVLCKAVYLQKKSRAPESRPIAEGQVVPEDEVYIKVFRRKWHEPRREGPYKMFWTTSTAVQAERSITWYHLNHCTNQRHQKRKRRRTSENKRENDSDNKALSNIDCELWSRNLEKALAVQLQEKQLIKKAVPRKAKRHDSDKYDATAHHPTM